MSYIVEDRNIIVFSDRVQHCQHMKELFDHRISGNGPTGDTRAVNGPTGDTRAVSGVFAGKMTPEERKSVFDTCDIIFCTYSMAKEGFDLKRLDTLAKHY